MREIKFRVWDLESKKMITPGVDSVIIITINGIFIDSDKYSVMQYTGLKDKDGKEIYEGDILTGNYRVGFGYYEDVGDDYYDGIGFYTTPVEEKYNWQQESITLTDVKQSEVIGNIYENPELLGGKK